MSEQISYQFQPTSPDTTLWRYLKFESFFYLIETGKMHFTFPQYFDDPFEGSYSRKTVEALEKWGEPYGEQNRRMIHLTNELPIGVTYWHRQEVENWLMWKYYGGDRGVAVATDLSLLQKSINNVCNQDFIAGDIRYIDLDEEDIQPLNYINKIFHKQKEFSAENESRISVGLHNVKDGFATETEKGFLIPLDPREWIKEVILSPELGFLEKPLQDWLSSKGYKCLLRSSKLSGSPHHLYETFRINAYVKRKDIGTIQIPKSIFIDAEEPLISSETPHSAPKTNPNRTDL